jgi:hypothetical protein
MHPKVTEGLKRVAEWLGQARQQLLLDSKELVTPAEGASDWQTAEVLFRLARSTDAILMDIKTLLDGLPPEEPTDLSADAELRQPDGHGEAERGYPRYRVEGDHLTKTGLSTGKSKTYEHSVPRGQFDAILRGIESVAAFRRQVRTADVQDKVSCPAYQVYTVISFLRDRGLLAQVHKGVYRVGSLPTLIADATRLWDESGKA